MQTSFITSILSLLSGILLSCVAGYFFIIGLATLFSGSYISVIIMAASLELSKIIGASWLYRNWLIAPLLIKIYMILSICVLVMITSMGIFGYLSKAHIDQNIRGDTNEISISLLQFQINEKLKTIESSKQTLSILDKELETLIKYNRIRGPEGAIAVRKSQSKERSLLNEEINNSQIQLNELQKQIFKLKGEQIKNESELGPLKYIAEFIYGERAKDHFDEAIRWIIFIIVS